MTSAAGALLVAQPSDVGAASAIWPGWASVRC